MGTGLTIISGGQTGVDRAALNVAGPRASKQPAIYAYAYAVIALLLKAPGSDG